MVPPLPLQFERLRRNHEAASRIYDHISLIELSHSLRIWAELKGRIDELAPKFAAAKVFTTGRPTKAVQEITRNHRHVIAYLPGGVRTHASKGHLVGSGPWANPEAGGDGCAVAAMGRKVPGGLSLKMYYTVATTLKPNEIDALQSQTLKRCTFAEWLGAEAVRLADLNEQNVLVPIGISREILIKRVANTLDGSHASVAIEPLGKNEFDAPVHHLMKFIAADLPLPYFLLLKMAQDLLEHGNKYFGKPDATGHT